MSIIDRQSAVNRQHRARWLAVTTSSAVAFVSGAGALWLVDHRLALANSGYVIGILMVLFFVSASTAFLVFLGQRDRARAATERRAALVLARFDWRSTGSSPAVESVHSLRPGTSYRVGKAFVDVYGSCVAEASCSYFRSDFSRPTKAATR